MMSKAPNHLQTLYPSDLVLLVLNLTGTNMALALANFENFSKCTCVGELNLQLKIVISIDCIHQGQQTLIQKTLTLMKLILNWAEFGAAYSSVQSPTKRLNT